MTEQARQAQAQARLRLSWLDTLMAGDSVAVDTVGARYLGQVIERTPSGRIRVRWPKGTTIFYGTNVVAAGELVGGRSSRTAARLERVGREITVADDLAAIGLGRADAPITAARLAGVGSATLARIAELSKALRAELDQLEERGRTL